MKRALNKGLFTPSPVVLIQACEMNEGGLSEVEERAIRELAVQGGARKVVVWDGNELSDNEVKEKLKRF